MFDPGALQKAADYDVFPAADLSRHPSTRYRVDAPRLRDLAVFREAPFAPEMVVIPAGEFMMGSDLGDAQLDDNNEHWKDGASEIAPGTLAATFADAGAFEALEIVSDTLATTEAADVRAFEALVAGQGKRVMRIPRRFAIGRYPVTFEEYDAFCDATRRKRPKDWGWERKRRPVINVSWDDAQAYVVWLNQKLGGKAYRLPSEAEWEYACRAGTSTRLWWGDSWDAGRANGTLSFEGGRTSPVDHFLSNAWKLHDMIGNVWEWCADEWVDDIARLPEDGAAFGFENQKAQTRQDKTKMGYRNAVSRAQRGGSWDVNSRKLSSAIRIGLMPSGGSAEVGFRLCRTL